MAKSHAYTLDNYQVRKKKEFSNELGIKNTECISDLSTALVR